MGGGGGRGEKIRLHIFLWKESLRRKVRHDKFRRKMLADEHCI